MFQAATPAVSCLQNFTATAPRGSQLSWHNATIWRDPCLQAGLELDRSTEEEEVDVDALRERLQQQVGWWQRLKTRLIELGSGWCCNLWRG